MNYTNHIITQINADGCSELPFVQTASQTYFNYLNGTAGYIVFLLGGGLLILAMVNKKKLKQMPGWVGGIIIAALALGALPALLPAFGVNLGCGGAGTEGIVTETPAQTPTPGTTPPAAQTPPAGGTPPVVETPPAAEQPADRPAPGTPAADA